MFCLKNWRFRAILISKLSEKLLTNGERQRRRPARNVGMPARYSNYDLSGRL